MIRRPDVILQRRQNECELRSRVVGERADESWILARQILVEGIHEEPERQVTLQLARGTLEHHAPVLAGLRSEFPEEAALTDPGFALHENREIGSSRHIGESTLELLQFSASSDEFVGDVEHGIPRTADLTTFGRGAQSRPVSGRDGSDPERRSGVSRDSTPAHIQGVRSGTSPDAGHAAAEDRCPMTDLSLEPRALPPQQAPDPIDDPADAQGVMTRRTLLRKAKLVAALTAVATAGGISYRAYDRGVLSAEDGVAFDAWETWRREDGPRALIASAILAASAHNTQPWTFRATPGEIQVFADRSRSLSAADPLGRELEISLGCALENLALAGAANGYRTRIAVSGHSDRIARVHLEPGERARSPLYEAIPNRHTNRYPFEHGRPITAQHLGAMTSLARGLPGTSVAWSADRRSRHAMSQTLIDATEAFTSDDEQSRAAFAWFRQDWDAFMHRRDGLNVDTAGLPDVVTAMAKLLPPQSRQASDKAWVASTRDRQTATAAAYGVVTVADASSTVQRVMGGRLLQRMHLWATANGLAFQHMNQVTERVDRERQLGLSPHFSRAADALVGSDSGEWLAAFRIGHPTREARRSPRREIAQVLRP